MKNVCKCVTGEYFNIDGSLTASINIEGLELNYSAYSCDSDFNTLFSMSFCPFCGESLTTLESRIAEYHKFLTKKAEAAELLKKKREHEKSVQAAKQLNDYRIENNIQKNTYIFNGCEIIAYNKREARKLLKDVYNIEISNKGAKKIVCTSAEPVVKKLTPREIRDINLKSKVGAECVCPSCGTKFVKNSYQHVFCKSKKGTRCKDDFWNSIR